MDKNENNEEKEKKTCFVIMPIGELSSYPPDHFRHVYEDIFVPAISKAGYKPKRADDTKAIMETKDNQKGINSIIKLLGVSPAQKANDNNNVNVLLFSLNNQLQKIINRLDDIDEGTLKNDTNPTLVKFIEE